tara:strand:+ start:146 stop:613 length:468 start_codon:yes stop_codon:yes gene_type:complete
MSETKLFRPCVGLVLINHDGLIFLGQRLDSNLDAWQMPQGGIDDGETPYQAGLREMMEEVGTNNVEFLGEMEEWLDYEIPNKLAKRLWDGKYIGQTQKWIAFRFLGKDEEININTKDPEFSTWKWEKANQALKLAVPFKKDIYKKVIEKYNEFLT